jgi:hypothetical protein
MTVTFETAATQTAFAYSPYGGIPGTPYDSQSSLDGLDASRIAGASVAFGRLVACTAAAPTECAVVSSQATVDRAIGISLTSNQYPSGGVGYPAGQPVRIARQGMYHVKAEMAYADLAAVYVRITTASGVGDGSDLGQFRADADGGKAVLVRNARWRSLNGVVAAAGAGVIEINFQPGVPGNEGPSE